ncbi:MAG: phospholipase D-like domain-containing protein [Campylobacterales bacterium]
MIRVVWMIILLNTVLLGKSFYVMPQEGARAEKALTQTLRSAEGEIVLFLYTFTNKTLSKALAQTAKRGVKIILVVDEKNLLGNLGSSQVPNLAKLENVTVFLAKGDRARQGYYGLMHHKLAVIDRRVIVHGSANWSNSAFNINHELMFIEEDERLAQRLLESLQPLIEGAKRY